MHDDMVELLPLWWWERRWWSSTWWGCKPCMRTCGKMFKSWGREQEERKVRCTGEWFDLNLGKTAFTFPLSCGYTALRELKATNKINSHWLCHVVHWRYTTLTNKSTRSPTPHHIFSVPNLLTTRLTTFSKAQLIGLCVAPLLYQCLSLDTYVYHNYNLQKAC